MGNRKVRKEEFSGSSSFAIFSFSQDLITSSFNLLQMACKEKKEGERSKPGGHYTINGPASIVLICTAFDQWLNQSALTLDGHYSGFREAAAEKSTVNKYYYFTEAISGSGINRDLDLQMAWDVRNEIVHWLPRKASSGCNWPEWLGSLQKRGLVLSSELPEVGDATDLATKLHSYRLARWVWQAISIAVENLLGLFPDEDQIYRSEIEWLTHGFFLFRQLPE